MTCSGSSAGGIASRYWYASEQKICELAVGYNKLVRKNDGQEYLISPFAPVDMWEPKFGC